MLQKQFAVMRIEPCVRFLIRPYDANGRTLWGLAEKRDGYEYPAAEFDESGRLHHFVRMRRGGYVEKCYILVLKRPGCKQGRIYSKSRINVHARAATPDAGFFSVPDGRENQD